MNFDFTLKSDQGSYEVQLQETKEHGDFLIDGKNFKISLEDGNGDSSLIQEAKIRLSQLNADEPVTLKKLYATIIDTNEENLNIDSKFLSINSINDLSKQSLGVSLDTVTRSQNHLNIPVNHSQYTAKIWKNVTHKKIDSIQTKINEKVAILGEYELKWDKLSIFEKISLVAANASLGSISRIGGQEALKLEIKKYKIELLEALFQDHQLSSVFDADSKNEEQKRIEEMAITAISIEQIAFLKDLLPKLESKTPLLLMVSMATNSKEAIKLVIQNGVNPNSNYWNHSILYWACLRGANDAIEALLQSGADPNILGEKNQNSILHKAFESQKTTSKSLNLFLDKTTNINIRNAEGKTLLHSAAEYGSTPLDLQKIDMLVNANIGVNIQDKKGKTALHTAIEKSQNNLAMVNKLIEANCMVDIFDLYSKTALHYAAEKASIDDDKNLESTQIILSLIENGATVNMQDIKGKTPLHYVAEGTEKSNNAALALIKHGAHPDIQDEDGNTALHIAVQSGNNKLIEILLKIGADRNIRNKEGHLPGTLAVHGLHTLFLTDAEKEKILKLLSQHDWT